MLKTDYEIQRDVMDELRCDPQVGSSELAVAVTDGVVTLSGHTSSFARKYAAMRAAQRIGGVREVEAEVSVDLPMAHRRTDADVARALAFSLEWNVEVPDQGVRARVEHGWVWLEGEVDWQFQSVAAEHAARTLTGVRGVTNLIRVWQRTSVPDLQQRIEDALKRHAENDAHQIRVESVDGVVTLHGQVRSWSERTDAELAAWSTPGVTKVDDKILVSL